jgi:hypothetical protein
MQFLALPLLTYLEMLLEASEEEDIEIAMTQVLYIISLFII